MSLKDTINKRIRAASEFRESIDGETFVVGGVSYTGVFEEPGERFEPEEAGYHKKQRLRGVARIDQFLSDPGTFDPANDYSAELPSRGQPVTLRGNEYRIDDTQQAHESWIFDLVEKRPVP
jgi:hypothetical protein